MIDPQPSLCRLAPLLPLVVMTACAYEFAAVIANEGGVIMSVATGTPARRTTPYTVAALHELLQRIEGEYREMPGLSVTARQAERLWGLDSTTCGFALMTLIQRGILKRTANGTYVRGYSPS